MKSKLLLILIAFSVSNLFAQTDSLRLKKDIDILNGKVANLESKIAIIQTTNTKILQENESIKKSQAIQNKNLKQLNSDFEAYKLNAENEIDSLQQVINSNSANIQTTAKELGVKIDNTHDFANQGINDLIKTISHNTLYWIIAVLFIALLSFLLFGWLKKQLSKEKTGLYGQIKKTSDALREEQLKLDGQLIKLLDTQMQLMSEEKQASYTKAKEVDHSLALKVADEIIRIQKNLNNMDAETKGLKQLLASVERIQDNFKANGYEIVDMLNKPYDQGMKISANFRPDENLKHGEQIITRIIKPQVNFKGVMIQAAQVEVSVGE